jgi:hypothetical protein
LAAKAGNKIAIDEATDMESKYTQTLANQQTIKVGDQNMTLNSYKIRQADTAEIKSAPRSCRANLSP